MTDAIRIVREPNAEILLPQDLPERNTLAVLRNAVGGTVDVIQLARGIDMWINDEGAFTEPFNSLATALCAEMVPTRGPWAVFGSVIITGERNGETVPLTEDQEQTVRDALVNALWGR